MRAFTLIALTSLALSGCANTGAEVSASPEIGPALSRVIVSQTCIQDESNVARPEVAPIVLALASALLPKAIDASVGLLGVAIQRAGEAQREPILSATTGAMGYGLSKSSTLSVNPDLGCLILARGRFNSKGDKFSDPHWTASATKTDDLKERLGINEDPDFYLEARFFVSDDHRSLRLEPVFLHVTPKTSLFGKANDLVINISFSTPGGESGKTLFGIATLDFAGFSQGGTWSVDALRGRSSRWINMPPPQKDDTDWVRQLATLSDSLATRVGELTALTRMGATGYAQQTTLQDRIKENIAKLAKPLVDYQDAVDKAQDDKNAGKSQLLRAKERLQLAEKLSSDSLNIQARTPAFESEAERLAGEVATIQAQQKIIRGSGKRAPINIEADVLEVRSANEYLLAVSKILLDSRKEITTAVNTNLDPTLRQQARTLEAREDAQAAADQAARLRVTIQKDQEVAQKRLALSLIDRSTAPEEYLRAQGALDLAIFDANEARRLAGLPSLN